MTEIVEDRLLFRFPDGWGAEKYDREDGFVGRKCKIDGTKRVDILALSPDALLMIEVKDFRTHAIENKHRKVLDGPDPLHVEVAQKVRDTIAFLFAAYRVGDDSLNPYCRHAFAKPDRRIEVILFLEEDEERARRGRSRSRTNLEAALKALLAPFGVRCHVQRRATMPSNSPWTVEGAAANIS